MILSFTKEIEPCKEVKDNDGFDKFIYRTNGT